MPAAFMRMIDTRLVRYLLASVGALAVDVGTFHILLTAGMWAAGASAIGYGLGIAAHWLMSSRAVFIGSVAQRGPARTRQKALFVVSAMAGLALTTGIVWAGDTSGLNPYLAKMAAIAVSFVTTWLLRSRVVFR